MLVSPKESKLKKLFASFPFLTRRILIIDFYMTQKPANKKYSNLFLQYNLFALLSSSNNSKMDIDKVF